MFYYNFDRFYSIATILLSIGINSDKFSAYFRSEKRERWYWRLIEAVYCVFPQSPKKAQIPNSQCKGIIDFIKVAAHI